MLWSTFRDHVVHIMGCVGTVSSQMDWERLPVAPLYADVRAYCSHVKMYCKRARLLSSHPRLFISFHILKKLKKSVHENFRNSVVSFSRTNCVIKHGVRWYFSRSRKLDVWVGRGLPIWFIYPLDSVLQNFLQSVSLHYTPKSNVCHIFDICNNTSSLVFDKLFDLL